MINIIAQNDNFIVVDKDAGLSFHSEAGSQGLVELLREQCSLPLWPVHRLDKATSGLLLLAKNQKTCRELCALFAKRYVQKFYFALSATPAKKMKKKQGAIIGDMVRTRNGNWKLSKSSQQPAVTQFYSYSLAPKTRLFILKPHTGKTHQLRVALKSIGAPILGDTRYGTGKVSCQRMYLHAAELRFTWRNRYYFYQSIPSDGEFVPLKSFLAEQQITVEQLPWPTLPPIAT